MNKVLKQRILFEQSEFILCNEVIDNLRQRFADLILCNFLIKMKVNKEIHFTLND